ncbi:GyrI-like domain-containing protein [Tamlana sp. 2_MG-2023]|uniref:SRPBCC family protein n=1 Tax=unclassified Tamlana TaxID=2614803 RepID=UPI0026E32E57|nr:MULTISPECIES: GyrI-like domain-containing protein [unclassified Tamlana]MDO6759032.1 GyrI-like domain-containing protein [Tamlana sp. 2_MG-2023]MDO6789731.1 GyrI-like domain-containing protein [Tamlana sp. 1_MG-2023]
MKVFKFILFFLLIVFIGTAIYIAVQPNEFSFNRSRVIKAPASIIYNEVNDYKNWPSFSPWIEQEPDATLTYEDKTTGVDAGYAWKGDVLGEGKMTTLAVQSNKSISQSIEFIEPFQSKSNIGWTFEPIEGGTKVTWAMHGKQDFMTKMYTTFAGSIEENTASDFDRGLFKLDSIVTTSMKEYSVVVNGLTEHGGGYYIYNTASCKISDISQKLDIMMPKISNYASDNNIKMAGAPFVNYLKWDTENNAAIFSCSIPTTEKVISTDVDILTGQLEAFKAIKTTLKGDYDNLKEAWETAMKYIPENGYEFSENGPMLEAYLTNPSTTPNPADWVTEIYIAVK